jgi:hypothetical protein
MRKGLDRHDAIHAICSVLTEHMFNLVKHGAKGQDVNVNYNCRIEELTAKGWLKSANEKLEEDDLE